MSRRVFTHSDATEIQTHVVYRLVASLGQGAPGTLPAPAAAACSPTPLPADPKPLIELVGSAGATYGVVSSLSVKGLAIGGFATAGILLTGSGAVVEGCYLGTDASATIARPNGVGVYVTGSHNVIGGLPPG